MATKKHRNHKNSFPFFVLFLCLFVASSSANQNVSFNPSCITRLLPEPTRGLPAATSGVAHPQPNVSGDAPGSTPKPEPFAAPYGLAMLGRLRTLNSSHRNWALYFSLNVKVLNTEKSTFLKPESRKMFRPIVPYVPTLGGTITDLPFADT